ncbi:origin recognition complex subunit 1 LALA0_S03e08174g [Lachancea lanzarotensis]|uniref:Origin recognition complex subunit 1 n=1 Tax=Lachancea lanzarotensis TaxID=1245769 RepID=A0A0C7N4Y4_9SACH|nr:uncharacterized protein LALA0_S03e08174g [Lachancea lanzarotensis]CEP61671.1 LALA0S03e08174g1_1 [Lachancea lanzarotensis]
MATSQQDFEGWEIVKRDENQNIVYDDLGGRRARRRTDKKGEKEYISLRRLRDGLEFGCGDSIVMRDAGTDDFSVYMVHEIRLNTLNHLVELWAFAYLRRFELNEREYLEACEPIKGLPASKLKSMSDAEVTASFAQICDSYELCLTAELSELYLSDFLARAEVYDPENLPPHDFETTNSDKTTPDSFLVQFACEPLGLSFREIDIHDVGRYVASQNSRDSHTFIKELTIKPVQNKGKKRIPRIHKKQDPKKTGPSVRPSPVEQHNPEDEKGPSSSDNIEIFQDALEEPGNSKNEPRNAPTRLFLASDSESGSSTRGDQSPDQSPDSGSDSNSEDEDEDEDEDEEVDGEIDEEVKDDSEVSDDDDEESGAEGTASDEEDDSTTSSEELDASFDDSTVKQPKRPSRTTSSSSRKRKVTQRSSTPSSPPKKALKSNASSASGIKKYSKKNVSRAKKAYTPFSKRFRRPQDIPDLTKIAEFNQDQIDMDVAAIENRLRSPKKQHTTETIFSKVKKQLYTSHGKDEIMKAGNFDDYLPARENEFASIYLSLYSAIEAGTGTTIYVAGTPGVGKTLTVREVVKELLQSVEQNELPNFQYAEVNGLKMIKPTDSYEVLWNKISGERLTSGAAMESLEFYFNKVPKSKKRPILVLLDELDALVTKSQDVMYNFFNWTTYANAKLIVVAVANTMDLPERQLGNKVSSRIGFTRIMFTGYTHEELKIIINLRLKGLNESYFYVNTANGSAHMVFNGEEEPDLDTSGMHKVKLRIAPDAVEIASRKIASVSGDARRALKACKRAVEIAEHEYMERHGYGYDGVTAGKTNGAGSILTEEDEVQSVQINHIMKALNETVNSPLVMFMANLPFTTKLFLYAMINLIRKTGNQEQPLGDIIDEIKSSIDSNGKNKFIVEMQRVLFNQGDEMSLEQLRIISWEYLVNQLIEAGIVIRQNLKNERLSAIKFNVSTEDVKSALNQDKVMKTL